MDEDEHGFRDSKDCMFA